MTTTKKNAEQHFTQNYLKVEEHLLDPMFEIEMETNPPEAEFYCYSKLGKHVLHLMDATTTYGDRGVHDAQVLINWLEFINAERDSDFTSEIIISLRCFILEAFIRRFRCQLRIANNQFIVTIPTSGRQISHLKNENYADLYRSELKRSRDYILRQVCPSFSHHRSSDPETTAQSFVATNEYYYLSSTWPDKITAFDDYLLSVAPSILDNNQIEVLTGTVAGIIKERYNNVDWSVLNTEAVGSPDTISTRIHQAVIDQISNPNKTAVFDLVKSLSSDFNPPSEVIGFEDSIFINPEDDKGRLRERYRMLTEFGIPPVSVYTKKVVKQAIHDIKWDCAFDPLMEDVMDRFIKSIDQDCIELNALDVYVPCKEDLEAPTELFEFIQANDYWSRMFTHHLIKEVIHQNYGIWE